VLGHTPTHGANQLGTLTAQTSTRPKHSRLPFYAFLTGGTHALRPSAACRDVHRTHDTVQSSNKHHSHTQIWTDNVSLKPVDMQATRAPHATIRDDCIQCALQARTGTNRKVGGRKGGELGRGAAPRAQPIPTHSLHWANATTTLQSLATTLVTRDNP